MRVTNMIESLVMKPDVKRKSFHSVNCENKIRYHKPNDIFLEGVVYFKVHKIEPLHLTHNYMMLNSENDENELNKKLGGISCEGEMDRGICFCPVFRGVSLNCYIKVGYVYGLPKPLYEIVRSRYGTSQVFRKYDAEYHKLLLRKSVNKSGSGIVHSVLTDCEVEGMKFNFTLYNQSQNLDDEKVNISIPYDFVLKGRTRVEEVVCSEKATKSMLRALEGIK